MAWHAIVVGVDRYPAFPPRAQLSGCVNDANAVRQFLIDRVDVPSENVRSLVSPKTPGAAPAATAANIRTEFNALRDRVGEGDHVVLFYAGHGVEISLADSEQRHYGFAPEDTAPEGNGFANLILGSEIHALMVGIERKGATATVIADTCHSGSSTRAIDVGDVRERRLQIEALSAEQWRDFEDSHPALKNQGQTRALTGAFGSYAGGDFVMLTGCLDSETAKEDSEIVIGADGARSKTPRGLMTLSLLKELESVSPEQVRSLRWMDFHDRLRRTVSARASALKASSQTVVLEGRPEKPVFGGAWRPFAPGFTVRKSADGVLTVDGGELQGLEPGAGIVIYPPDTADFDRAGIAGVPADIDSATAMTSIARVTDQATTVVDLSRARLVRTGPATTPIVIRATAAVLPDTVRTAVPQSDAFHLVDDVGAAAHAELRRWDGEVPLEVWPKTESSSGATTWQGARDGWILVSTDRFGAPAVESAASPSASNIVAYLPVSGGPIDSIGQGGRDAVLGTALGKGLAAYGRYLQKRDRRAGDSTLASMLEVKLCARTGPEPAGRAELEAIPALEPVDGVHVLSEADWICAHMAVKRSTSLRLQIAWVLFSDDGNVFPIWPPKGGQPSLKEGTVVRIGFDRETALRLPKRADQPASMYTLSVLAATGKADGASLDVSALEQPSVQEEFAAALQSAGGVKPATHRGQPVRPEERPAWYRWDLRVAIGAAGR